MYLSLIFFQTSIKEFWGPCSSSRIYVAIWYTFYKQGYRSFPIPFHHQQLPPGKCWLTLQLLQVFFEFNIFLQTSQHVHLLFPESTQSQLNILHRLLGTLFLLIDFLIIHTHVLHTFVYQFQNQMDTHFQLIKNIITQVNRLSKYH